jgi:hypothetical protein
VKVIFQKRRLLKKWRLGGLSYENSEKNDKDIVRDAGTYF